MTKENTKITLNGAKNKPLNTVELKAFRSKKYNSFFKFEKYYEDGFGEYICGTTEHDIVGGDLPSLFPLDTSGRRLNNFLDHTKDEIEEVKITVIIGDKIVKTEL